MSYRLYLLRNHLLTKNFTLILDIGSHINYRRTILMATLVEIAGQLVAAHAASSKLTTEELILEISKVHAALQALESGQVVEVGEEAKPALTVKEAFKKNEVICMVCGKGGFKTLARHLSTAHQMKPSAYRKQFGISRTQALSAKSYSESRRAMALDRGLADNLAKARQVRMGNIEAKKAVTAKAEKAKALGAVKAPVKSKAPAKVKASTADKTPAKAPKVKAAPKAK
jgi:predicted transcriptional regulator